MFLAIEFFNPTEDPNFIAEYDRIVQSEVETESVIQIDMWVQSDETAEWRDTAIRCSCGCPPVDFQEIKTIRSSADEWGNFNAILIGTYFFNMRNCNTDVDVTFTFSTNINTASATVVKVSLDTNGKDDSSKLSYLILKTIKDCTLC